MSIKTKSIVALAIMSLSLVASARVRSVGPTEDFPSDKEWASATSSFKKNRAEREEQLAWCRANQNHEGDPYCFLAAKVDLQLKNKISTGNK
jgi:hypothetical protein